VASLHLQRNKALVFVATNRDTFDRLSDRNVPGNGCALAAVEASVGYEAVTVGKPSPWLIRHIVAANGLDPARMVVVGDRLDTDIMLGVVGGIDSVLVGTGCATLEDVDKARDAEGGGLPTYVLSHVGALAEAVVNGGGGSSNGSGV